MPGVKLTDVNPELVCVLCHGYFIDATAIKECLHSFCRSCIILYLEAKNQCPKCQVPINTSKPHLSLKPDKTRQDIVYKLVPGLFHSEMRRRQEFYKKNSHRDLHLHPEARGVDVDRLIYSPEDPISLSLEYYDSDREKEEWGNGVGKGDKSSARALGVATPATKSSRPAVEASSTHHSPSKQVDRNMSRKRYLQCPAEVSMHHLKKFIRMKHDLPPNASIELFYKRESLPDDYSLMDIAYIYTWKRNGPMRFYYQIHIPVPVSSESTKAVKEAAAPATPTAIVEAVHAVATEPEVKSDQKPQPAAPAVVTREPPAPSATTIPKPEAIPPNGTHPRKKSMERATPTIDLTESETETTKVPESPKDPRETPVPSTPPTVKDNTPKTTPIASKPKSICYREATFPSPEKHADPLAAYDFEEEKSPTKNLVTANNRPNLSSAKLNGSNSSKASKLNGKGTSNVSNKLKSSNDSVAKEADLSNKLPVSKSSAITSTSQSSATPATVTAPVTGVSPSVSAASGKNAAKDAQPEGEKSSEPKEILSKRSQQYSSGVKPSEQKTSNKPSSKDNNSAIKSVERKTPTTPMSQDSSSDKRSEHKAPAKPILQDSSVVKLSEHKTPAKPVSENSSTVKHSEHKTPAKPILQDSSAVKFSEYKTSAKTISQDNSTIKRSEPNTLTKSSSQNSPVVKPSEQKSLPKQSSKDSFSAITPSEHASQAKPSSKDSSTIKLRDIKPLMKPTPKDNISVKPSEHKTYSSLLNAEFEEKKTSEPRKNSVKPSEDLVNRVKDVKTRIDIPTSTEFFERKSIAQVKECSGSEADPGHRPRIGIPTGSEVAGSRLPSQAKIGAKTDPQSMEHPSKKSPLENGSCTSAVAQGKTSPKPQVNKNGDVRPSERPYSQPTYMTSDYMNDRIKRFEKLVNPDNKKAAPQMRMAGVSSSLNRNVSNVTRPIVASELRQNENKIEFPSSSPNDTNKLVKKNVMGRPHDVALKRPSNGIRFDSPNVAVASNSGLSVKKSPVSISPSPRPMNGSTATNQNEALKRKRSELERCIETENGCLSVSLLSQSQQEIEAKKMKMVEPDVSIQLMSFSCDKKSEATKPLNQNRIAQAKENAESPKLSVEAPKANNESPKLCNSTKSNLSPPKLQPLPGQKRENGVPLDLSSGPGGPSTKATKSPTPPDKRRKMPPLAPLRVPPPLTSLTDLSEKSAALKNAVSSANEQRDFSKYPKEAIELLFRHQFNNNNNKSSEKIIDELMMNCQNYVFPPPYSLMRPGNGLSPESVRK